MNRADWRLRFACIALPAGVLVGCGGGENAGEAGHGDLAAGTAEAGHPDAAGEKVGSMAPGDASPSAADTIGPTTLDAVSNLDSAFVDRTSIDVGIEDSGPDTGTDSRGDVGGDAKSDTDDECGDACGNIGITLNVCPEILAYSVSPPAVTVGADVHLTSSAHDDNGDVLTFQWSATQGTFIDANAANTTYRCATPGTATLTLIVWDGKCGDAIDQDIQCN